MPGFSDSVWIKNKNQNQQPPPKKEEKPTKLRNNWLERKEVSNIQIFQNSLIVAILQTNKNLKEYENFVLFWHTKTNTSNFYMIIFFYKGEMAKVRT